MPGAGRAELAKSLPEERMSAVPANESVRRPLPPGELRSERFTVYTLLRGFENAMRDFLLDPRIRLVLMDRIVEFSAS